VVVEFEHAAGLAIEMMAMPRRISLAMMLMEALNG